MFAPIWARIWHDQARCSPRRSATPLWSKIRGPASCLTSGTSGQWLIKDTACTIGRLEVLAVGRYVSEAWFGRQLARHPPANRRASNSPARPELTRPAGMTLITTGTVLLAVSIPLPFLNVKLLGLIMIVAGLVKVRALQRASGWLWQNRRVRNGPARPPAGPAPALGHGQPEPVRQAR